MNENIIAYLKEHGKVNINDLAAGLDMTGAEKFPLLVKEISQLESQGELRFDDSGSLALRKKVEKKKEITVTGVFRANKAGFGFLSVDEDEDDMFVGRNDVGQQIKIKLTRADKETGDIDFEYIPSDYDVIEKVKKSRKDRSGKDKRRPKSDNRKDHKKDC
jgi:exoribonuclease R